MWVVLGVILGLFFPQKSEAIPRLTDLNSSQVDALFRVLAADLAFRPVEPASAYGKYFGFTFGVIVIATSTNKLSNVLPGTNIRFIPGADVFFGLQLPLGLAFELGVLPRVNSPSIKAQKGGWNLKWTVTEVFGDKAPMHMALRLNGSQTLVTYTQNLSGGTAELKYKSRVYGANISFSKKFLYIFEPYMGAGVINHKSQIDASGSVRVLNQDFYTGTSVSSSEVSPWLYMGMQIRLLILTLSFEYDRIFKVDTMSAKLGFKF